MPCVCGKSHPQAKVIFSEPLFRLISNLFILISYKNLFWIKESNKKCLTLITDALVPTQWVKLYPLAKDLFTTREWFQSVPKAALCRGPHPRTSRAPLQSDAAKRRTLWPTGQSCIYSLQIRPRLALLPSDWYFQATTLQHTQRWNSKFIFAERLAFRPKSIFISIIYTAMPLSIQHIFGKKVEQLQGPLSVAEPIQLRFTYSFFNNVFNSSKCSHSFYICAISFAHWGAEN